MKVNLNYAGDFLRGWRSQFEISSALGQVEAVAAGAGVGVHLARPRRALVPVLREHRATRSYWLAVHEDLKAAARIRATAEFIVEAVAAERAGFAAEDG